MPVGRTLIWPQIHVVARARALLLHAAAAAPSAACANGERILAELRSGSLFGVWLRGQNSYYGGGLTCADSRFIFFLDFRPPVSYGQPSNLPVAIVSKNLTISIYNLSHPASDPRLLITTFSRAYFLANPGMDNCNTNLWQKLIFSILIGIFLLIKFMDRNLLIHRFIIKCRYIYRKFFNALKSNPLRSRSSITSYGELHNP